MMPLTQSQANTKKIAQLEMAVREMLREVLRQGFFGTTAIELSVQDGTIQRILRKVERVER